MMNITRVGGLAVGLGALFVLIAWLMPDTDAPRIIQPAVAPAAPSPAPAAARLPAEPTAAAPKSRPQPLSSAKNAPTSNYGNFGPTVPAEFDGTLGQQPPACAFNVIQSIYLQEPRDEVWATMLEQDVRVVARAIPGVTITEGECHTSICRFQIAYESRGPGANNQQEFSLPLHRLTDGTDFAVTLRINADGDGKDAIYLFSVKPPAAWVAPYVTGVDKACRRQPLMTRRRPPRNAP